MGGCEVPPLKRQAISGRHLSVGRGRNSVGEKDAVAGKNRSIVG